MEELNWFIFCYNHCIIHDKKFKEKWRLALENQGIVFVEYKHKLYIYDIRKKSAQNKQLYKLGQLIKEVNQIFKKDKNIINESKNHGFYFVNLNGYLYFEKFVYHEMITYLYQKAVSFPASWNIKAIYDNYKKNE